MELEQLISGPHMRPAFVLDFCVRGAIIKGNNCSSRGQMTAFRDNFKPFPHTRGGDPTDVTIKETADSFFHIRGSDPDMAFGTAFLFCFPY